MEIFNIRLTELSQSEVRRYAGLRKSAFDEKKLASAKDNALILSEPRASMENFLYNDETGTVTLTQEMSSLLNKEQVNLDGASIRKHLKGSVRVIFLAVTIGEAIEKTVSDTFDSGDYSDALLLDAAATTAVEAAADELCRQLKLKYAREGFTLTPRFSPGYGDFPLEAQRGVLPLTGGDKISIKLTENSMLSPRKSITALVGLKPVEAEEHEEILSFEEEKDIFTAKTSSIEKNNFLSCEKCSLKGGKSIESEKSDFERQKEPIDTITLESKKTTLKTSENEKIFSPCESCPKKDCLARRS